MNSWIFIKLLKLIQLMWVMKYIRCGSLQSELKLCWGKLLHAFLLTLCSTTMSWGFIAEFFLSNVYCCRFQAAGINSTRAATGVGKSWFKPILLVHNWWINYWWKKSWYNVRWFDYYYDDKRLIIDWYILLLYSYMYMTVDFEYWTFSCKAVHLGLLFFFSQPT